MADNRGYIALCDQVIAQTQIFDYLTETALTLNLKSKLKYKWFRREAVGVSSKNRGYFSNQDFLEYNKVGKPMWTTGSIDGIDFATETTIKIKAGLTVNRIGITGLCSAARGYFCGNGSLVDGLDFGSETMVTLYEGLKSLSVNKPGSYGTSEVGYVISSELKKDNAVQHVSSTDKITYSSETTTLSSFSIESPTLGNSVCIQSMLKGYEKNSSKVLDFSNESITQRTVQSTSTNCGALSHTTAGYWLGGQENGKSVNKLDFVSGIESTLSTTFGINVFGQATASKNLLSLPVESGTGYGRYSNRMTKFDIKTETVALISFNDSAALSESCAVNSETKAYTFGGRGDVKKPYFYPNYDSYYYDYDKCEIFDYSTETVSVASYVLDMPATGQTTVQSGTAGYITQGYWSSYYKVSSSPERWTNVQNKQSPSNFKKFDFSTETISVIKAKTKNEAYTCGLNQRVTRNDNNLNRSLIASGYKLGYGWAKKADKFDLVKESASPVAIGLFYFTNSGGIGCSLSSSAKAYASNIYSLKQGWLPTSTLSSVSFVTLTEYTTNVSPTDFSFTYRLSGICSRNSAYTFGAHYKANIYSPYTYDSIVKLSFASETTSTLSAKLSSNGFVEVNFQKNTVPKLVHIGKGYFNAGYSDSYKFVLQAVKSIHFVNDIIRVLSMTLNSNRSGCAPASSSFMGYYAGGTGIPKFGAVLTYYQVIDGVEYSTETLFKAGMKLSTLRTKVAGNLNSSTKGYFVGGETSTGRVLSIEAILFAKNKAANPLITLTEAVSDRVGFGSLENGYIGWGSNANGALNSVDKLIYSTESLSTLSSTFDIAADRKSTLLDTLNAYLIKTILNGSAIASDGYKFTYSSETTAIMQSVLKVGRLNCATVSSKVAGYITNGSMGKIVGNALEQTISNVEAIEVEKFLFATSTSILSNYSFTDSNSDVGVSYSL